MMNNADAPGARPDDAPSLAAGEVDIQLDIQLDVQLDVQLNVQLDAQVQSDLPVDVDLSFDLAGLHALRSTVAAHASQLGATETELDALVIIASELATNAIRHGGGAGRLRLWHDEDHLFVQITDEGPGIGHPSAGEALPSPDRVGGRGLWIVRSLSDELLVGPGPGGRGTRVTVQRRRVAGRSG